MFSSVANMTKKEEIVRDFWPCRWKKLSNREGETIVQRNTWQREKKKKEIWRDRNKTLSVYCIIVGSWV